MSEIGCQLTVVTPTQPAAAVVVVDGHTIYLRAPSWHNLSVSTSIQIHLPDTSWWSTTLWINQQSKMVHVKQCDGNNMAHQAELVGY